MNIGFCTYSLPFKWFSNSNIAHNKIFAWIVMELNKRTNHKMFLKGSVDFETSRHLTANKVCIDPGNKHKCDVMFVFCGPHMPITPKSICYSTIDLISKFEGHCIFITCDYLLQFDFNIRRYGKLFEGYAEDCLYKNKTWGYVLHGGLNHHFRTAKQLEKAHIGNPTFHEVPLNKAGIHPNWKEEFKYNKNPTIDTIYCGAYRPDREMFFDKYFCDDSAKTWIISTSSDKFAKMKGIKVKEIANPFSGKLWSILNKSVAQLLICDKGDTKQPSTPLPTRYWESLSAQVPVFADRSMEKWHDITKYEVPTVNSAVELQGIIEAFKMGFRNRKDHVNKQNEHLENFSPYDEWKLEELIKG